MTIRQALEQLRQTVPGNGFSEEQMIRWLSQLDGLVTVDVEGRYGAPAPFPGYDRDTELDRVLLVGAPFEELYLRWMEAQMDYENREYAHYDNSFAMFHALYEEYKKYRNRVSLPQSRGTCFRI